MANVRIKKPLHSIANPITVRVAEWLSGCSPATDQAIRQTQSLQRRAAVLAQGPEEAGRFAGHVLEKMCTMRGHDRVSASNFVCAVTSIFKSVQRDFSAESAVDHARHYGFCVRDQIDGRFVPAPAKKNPRKRTPSNEMPKWFQEAEIHVRQNPNISNGQLAKAVDIDKSMFSKQPYKGLLEDMRQKYSRG